ncbi:MAG: sugar phosphate isomerase/epimerase family protein [Oscillospiraceae bacterium]|nr:sugar phosphate isomerase/epimerase family protein [Oscillospiraceae bacterium]
MSVLQFCVGGIFTWFGYSLPYEERLRRIREAGFGAVCTWWGDTFAAADGPKEGQPALCARAGLTLAHAHLPYYGCDALWRADSAGDGFAADTVAGIRAAARCGVPVLVFHPYDDPAAEAPGADPSAFFAHMDRIAAAAEACGVRLAVENLRGSGVLRAVLRRYADNERIGFCFDSGHNNIADKDDFSLFGEFPGRLFALHLHDNGGTRDEHLLPFEGNVRWDLFCAALRATSFDGPLMLESSSPCIGPDGDYAPPQEPAARYLARAKRAVDALASRCGAGGQLR